MRCWPRVSSPNPPLPLSPAPPPAIPAPAPAAPAPARSSAPSSRSRAALRGPRRAPPGPGLAEPPRVLGVLLQEQLDVADGEVGGRQAGEIGAPGRGRRGRHLRGAAPAREVRTPAHAVRPVVPHPVVERVERCVGSGAVIEHGREEPLRAWLRPVLVVQALDQPRGEASAGALTADRDPVRGDAELRGVREHPLPRGMHVLVRGGEGVLGSEAVVRRDDHDPELARGPGAQRLVLPGVAEQQPSAVDPQQGGVGVTDPRPVDPQPQPVRPHGPHRDGVRAGHGHEPSGDPQGGARQRPGEVRRRQPLGRCAQRGVDLLDVHPPILPQRAVLRPIIRRRPR